MTGIIALNELRRRLRDRSVLITAIVAPLAIAAILGFAFANRPPTGPLPIGVSGASPAVVRAAAHAAQLPPNVTVHTVTTPSRLEREVADGTLAGGVVAYRVHRSLGNLLIPMVSPGATKTPGFKVVDRANALVGQETAQAVAAGLASRLYAARLGNGPASGYASLNVEAATVGNGGKAVLDYFAPSIAVVFLFIGSGLGMRSLMLERTGGTLVRIAASPVRPSAVVTGKLLAVGITGLVSILVVWGATTAVFGADWGDPLGRSPDVPGRSRRHVRFRRPGHLLRPQRARGLRGIADRRPGPGPPRREPVAAGRAARVPPGAQPGHAERLGPGRIRAPVSPPRPGQRRRSGRFSCCA